MFSRLASLGIWVLAMTYVASLVGALALTLRSGAERPRWAGAGSDSGPPPLVLLPLREPRAERTVETRLPGVRVRRLCADGRCEVLAGRATGFELLASVPADRVVVLERADGRLHVQEIGARPRVGPAASLPVGLLWLAVILLGAPLLALTITRSTALSTRLAELVGGRSGFVDAQGNLHFVDDRQPRRVALHAPLPPGPATGLRPLWTLQPDWETYRERAAPPWRAVSGQREDLLVRTAGARATTLALGGVVLVVTLAAVTALAG